MPRCDSRNCAACEKEGVIRAADRVKSNGEGLCDEHFRKEFVFGGPALLAKFCALAIIDLAQGGRDVEVEAQLWLRLFGNLPEFASLTQLPS